MEATGSSWKPVWYVLEGRGFDQKLVNAQHLKILPGRKSDVLGLADIDAGAWLDQQIHRLSLPPRMLSGSAVNRSTTL